ncbi:unnamed protein product [Allacma fusca]|uniref:DUF5641 domain-containing protein n=1 Tax=Allacma fusca TaxID=39272 RepID=A0A8J2NNT3_9HEXA|nr:unnamed protein product [Allacma fusca]
MSQSKELRKVWQDEGVIWEFNPPSAPPFGGLWKAGVKATKHHLWRVLGEAFLTYEEMSHILAQVEDCLNCRPLIGRPLVALPDQDFAEIPLNRLNRWQKLQQMVQHFWSRWVGEYLTRLQERPKWYNAEPNVKTGELIIIKDERVPPSKWKLGRIIQCHPGDDSTSCDSKDC